MALRAVEPEEDLRTGQVIPFGDGGNGRRGRRGNDGAPGRDRPETLWQLPDDNTKLIDLAKELIETCRASSFDRSAYCRALNIFIESGRADGGKSLVNLMRMHIDRLSAHLFSPTELRFNIDYEREYQKPELERAQVASRLLSREWEQTNTDMTWSLGVTEALKYGAALLKQTPYRNGPDGSVGYRKGLIMPWQFGVYREDQNDLDLQPCMVETTLLTPPEVWRRIFHLPNARAIYDRIKGTMAKGAGTEEFSSFFHQVLSVSQLDTSPFGINRPRPGGIVQLNQDPSYAIVSPRIEAEVVKMHEIWVWDGDDYTTIQLIEPDILIAPLLKRCNLLIPGQGSQLHPYRLIQPNQVHGYFWGMPEIVDLMEPQGLLATWCDDVKRLFGLQIDKILAFEGDGMPNDERYAQFRTAGYANLGPQGKVQDLTPQFPGNALEMLNFCMKVIDQIGGFDNLLSGKGEEGVRAGVHASTLLKTASPRLRDRSLLVERQCADAADLRFSLMQAKDGKAYWTNPEQPAETSFLLADLPSDRRVSVDSHSGSPIFADDHVQMVSFGLKAGIVDGRYALETLPFPNKDMALQALKEKEAKHDEMIKQLMQRDPEAAAKLMGGGGKKGKAA
jgi:hypothetical protein